MHAFRYLAIILCGSMSMSSCTCHREVPEPPTTAKARSGGFGALATRVPPRAVPEKLAELESLEPTRVPELPTPLAEVDVPEDFPADVPLFEGSKAFAVQQLAGNARNVLFEVEAEAPVIFRHYREEMQREGWSVTQEYEAQQQSFLSFKKGDMIANMTISKHPRTGKEIVGIMYQEEEPLPFPEF